LYRLSKWTGDSDVNLTWIASTSSSTLYKIYDLMSIFLFFIPWGESIGPRLRGYPPFPPPIWLWSHASTIEKNSIIFNHVHVTHIGMPNRKWMNK